VKGGREGKGMHGGGEMEEGTDWGESRDVDWELVIVGL